MIGWKVQPYDQDPNYRLWTMSGGGGRAPLGGLMRLDDAARRQGTPPYWMMYVAVPVPHPTIAFVRVAMDYHLMFLSLAKTRAAWQNPSLLAERFPAGGEPAVSAEQQMLADYQKVPASICMWSGPTPPGGVVTEVALAGTGAAQADLKGKLVLGSRTSKLTNAIQESLI